MHEKEILTKIDIKTKIESDFDEIEKKLSKGLIFGNHISSLNREDIKENKALLDSLIETLISKGFIHFHELEERKKKIIQSFNKNDEQMPKIHLVETSDKYLQGNEVSIDCENIHAICGAVCCKLWFALSVQDINEGILKWDYMKPYGIAQDKDGNCIHKDLSHNKCKIYKNRPLVCRTYDCRQDKRIWIDFENKIINQDLGHRIESDVIESGGNKIV